MTQNRTFNKKLWWHSDECNMCRLYFVTLYKMYISISLHSLMAHLFCLPSFLVQSNLLSIRLKIREPFPRQGPLNYLAALMKKEHSRGSLQLEGYVKMTHLTSNRPLFHRHSFHGPFRLWKEIRKVKTLLWIINKVRRVTRTLRIRLWTILLCSASFNKISILPHGGFVVFPGTTQLQ